MTCLRIIVIGFVCMSMVAFIGFAEGFQFGRENEKEVVVSIEDVVVTTLLSPPIFSVMIIGLVAIGLLSKKGINRTGSTR